MNIWPCPPPDGKALPRLSCLGRITCPLCGRPDTAVQTRWRMYAHNRPFTNYEDRVECPGAQDDAVLRAALRLTEARR